MNNDFVNKVLSALVLFCISCSATYGGEFTIDQKYKKFSATSVTIKRGDTITFTNSDPMTHNIHSLSSYDSFDLGSYTKGEVRKHTFNKVGLVEVECAIHPFMYLTIKVE